MQMSDKHRICVIVLQDYIHAGAVRAQPCQLLGQPGGKAALGASAGCCQKDPQMPRSTISGSFVAPSQACRFSLGDSC